MITSKQRAKLRGLANPLDTILQVGKEGVGDAFVKQVDDALEARELIKVRCLDNSGEDPREVAGQVAERVNADVVQVIGSRFVLYRQNKKLPHPIEING